MKTLVISPLILVLTTAAFAQQGSTAVRNTPVVTPPPTVNSLPPAVNTPPPAGATPPPIPAPNTPPPGIAAQPGIGQGQTIQSGNNPSAQPYGQTMPTNSGLSQQYYNNYNRASQPGATNPVTGRANGLPGWQTNNLPSSGYPTNLSVQPRIQHQ